MLVTAVKVNYSMLPFSSLMRLNAVYCQFSRWGDDTEPGLSEGENQGQMWW